MFLNSTTTEIVTICIDSIVHPIQYFASVALHYSTAYTQDKIENLREMGFSGLPSSNSSVTEDYDSITYSSGGETVNYPAFKRVTSVTTEDPAAGMKTITVQVYRRSGLNPTTFSAIMAE